MGRYRVSDGKGLADKLEIAVPSDRKILDDYAKYRSELVDTALEMDDDAMEAYLTDDVPPTADVLRACIRKGAVTSAFTPVLAAPLIRTRACSRCWTPSSTTCRPRRTSRHQDRGRGRQSGR